MSRNVFGEEAIDYQPFALSYTAI